MTFGCGSLPQIQKVFPTLPDLFFKSHCEFNASQLLRHIRSKHQTCNRDIVGVLQILGKRLQ